ncbi:putative cytochrome P450 [Poronia punctata]|nr:putative cytochrome P450 [Poronia punctata]
MPLIIGFTALAVVVCFITYRLFFNPLSKIPGPWYTNLTSIVLKVENIRGRGPIYVDGLHKQYGPVIRLGPDEFDVSDMESVKKIHRVKTTFPKTAFYTGFTAGPGHDNVFSAQNVEIHRRQRRLLSQAMSEASLKTMVPQIEDKVRLTIRKMEDEMRDRGAVDVCKWWMLMTADVIGQLTFGRGFGMVEMGMVTSYIADLQLAGVIGTLSGQFPALKPILRHVPIPGTGESVERIEKRRRAFSRKRLGELREEVRMNGDNMDPLLFTKLIQGKTRDGGDEPLTKDEIQSSRILDAEAYLTAGTDTTSNTLTYITWSLCDQPHLRDRLVEELKGLPTPFTDDDLKKLPFLTRCITEGLRRYPVVPAGLPRQVPKEGAEFNGIWLPGGSTVTTQSWTLHRNPDVFPNPDVYDPSRWESPSKEMRDSFMAFGGGSRVCIGIHLAWMELRLGLANFFLAFPNSRVSGSEGMSKEDMTQALYFLSSPVHHRCLIEAM